VLAMPLQGIAAATMRFCAPGHHSKAMHSEGEPAAHRQGVHAPSSAAPHHHEEQPQADADSAHSKDGLAKTGTLKCSVCAVCCMAAAVAPAMPTVHGIEASSKITPPASASYVGPAADGLERPPRPFLA